MTSPSQDQPLYRCTICDTDWSYEAVQYVARCRACGGTLLSPQDIALHTYGALVSQPYTACPTFARSAT